MSILSLLTTDPKARVMINKLEQVKALGDAVTMSSLNGNAVKRLLAIFDTDISAEQADELAKGMSDFVSGEAEQTLTDFVTNGGLLNIVRSKMLERSGVNPAIAEPIEKLALRCDKCGGLNIYWGSEVERQLDSEVLSLSCNHCGLMNHYRK